jgi:nucleoside-diphosphate-sugar epimerase
VSRVLLTGGTGFLGSHVAELLAASGRDVRATVRRTSDTRWLDPLPIETTVVDLADPAGLESALDGVSEVVHVGGLTSAPDAATYHRVNEEGTAVLAEAAAAAGARRFVYVSSLAARGPDGEAGPTSDYGRSKLGGERRLAELAAAGRAPGIVRILRPGGIYGPRDSDSLALHQMASRGFLALPAGEGRVLPVYVSDVATAVMRALDLAADAPDPGPLPVAGESVATWTEIAEALEAAVGRRVRVIRLPAAVFLAAGAAAEVLGRVSGRTPPLNRRRARDVASAEWTCEIESTKRALGWEPEVGLNEGMRRTTAWYREHGWL